MPHLRSTVWAIHDVQGQIPVTFGQSDQRLVRNFQNVFLNVRRPHSEPAHFRYSQGQITEMWRLKIKENLNFF